MVVRIGDESVRQRTKRRWRFGVAGSSLGTLTLATAAAIAFGSWCACAGGHASRGAERTAKSADERARPPRSVAAPIVVGPALEGPRRPNDGSTLGVNLTEPSYYSEAWPFVDVLKHGEFHSGRPEHPDPSKRWNDGARLDVDARGWIRRLAPGQVARVFVFGSGTHYRPGRYTVLYDGRGRIEYRGAVSNVARAPGRESFDLAPRGELWLELHAIDARDPIRDLHVIPPGGRCADDPAAYCDAATPCGGDARCEPFVETFAEQPFHPDFLADIAPFRILRFLDWVKTNRPADAASEEARAPFPASVAAWPTRAHATYKPVPFEVMIDLCNTVHADLWLPVPGWFDDASVQRLASLVRERLDPTLRVWVEHSNEVWNGQFGQHYATAARECARSGDADRRICDGDRDGTLCEPGPWDRERERCFEMARRGHARRTGEIAHAFERAFGAAAPRRVVRVLAWQTGSLHDQGEALLDFRWNGSEPLHSRIDAVAVAPYFGGSIDVVPPADVFFARNPGRVHGAPEGTFAVLSGAPDGEPGPYARIASDAAALRSPRYAHLRLVAYEGGQHLFTWADGQGDALRALNSDPRMRALYTQYLTYFHELTGGSYFVHYASPGGWWHHGAFGSKQYQGQRRAEAPKHDALESFVEAQRGR